MLNDRDGAAADSVALDGRASDGAAGEVGRGDGAAPDVIATDVITADGAAIDAVMDASPADVASPDVTVDASVRDDVSDVPVRPDVVAMDAGVDVVRPDVAPSDARVDVVLPDVVPLDVALPDVAPVDVARADTGGGGCTTAAPTVAIAAPLADEMVETCSTAGSAVFYDFRANVAAAAGVVNVTARWITPDGAEAPPTANSATPPFTFRRQVGGPSTGTPALAVFGLRGTWRFEVTVADTCGRTATASQNFTLIFTSRRCPNP